jgi:fructokinase
MNIVSIGEVLWDVVGKDEHLGGATFNFSAHLRKLGHNVAFVSGVGNDERGERILRRMDEMKLSTRWIHVDPQHETGVVTVTINDQGVPSFVLHRPAAYDFPQLGRTELHALAEHSPDWIYFGTLHQIGPQAKNATATLIESFPHARRFYDVNLRKDAYSPDLIKELMGRASVVKLNDEEVVKISQMFGDPFDSFESFCRVYSERFGWDGVCITCGPRGCVALMNREYLEADGYSVDVKDTVGSGDAFSAAFLHGISSGWPAQRIMDFANRLGALVASQVGAIPPWTIDQAMALKQTRLRSEPA